MIDKANILELQSLAAEMQVSSEGLETMLFVLKKLDDEGFKHWTTIDIEFSAPDLIAYFIEIIPDLYFDYRRAHREAILLEKLDALIYQVSLSNRQSKPS